MSKLKTKSGAKKRFKLTGSGKVRVQYGYKRHNLRKRPQQMKRQTRGMKVLDKAETQMVKRHYLPYSESGVGLAVSDCTRSQDTMRRDLPSCHA